MCTALIIDNLLNDGEFSSDPEDSDYNPNSDNSSLDAGDSDYDSGDNSSFDAEESDLEVNMDVSDTDSEMDDFIVKDDEDVYDNDGNKFEYNKDKIKEELDAIVDELSKPKLHLNPNPTYNPAWQQNKKKMLPDDITTEKERIKWLIENNLGPNMTLQDYVKYLEEQEKIAVDNFINKNKRKLEQEVNSENKKIKKDKK